MSTLDNDFVAMLSTNGVLTAAKEIGLDIDKYLIPLAQRVDHPYRTYRWAVGFDKDCKIAINALPPEEEMGWTPWEQWVNENGKVIHRQLVMYPAKNITNGIVRWYELNDFPGIEPRFLRRTETFLQQLKAARIDVAAEILGLNTEEVFVKSLSEMAKVIYSNFRWAIIPHQVSADAPVIYALPPMNHADRRPWESWYTDGKVPLIHHVHYTAETSDTIADWQENPGAAQRPPEVFGVVWYWYDDPSMTPALADAK